MHTRFFCTIHCSQGYQHILQCVVYLVVMHFLPLGFLGIVALYLPLAVLLLPQDDFFDTEVRHSFISTRPL
jgi:hypothetical protein